MYQDRARIRATGTGTRLAQTVNELIEKLRQAPFDTEQLEIIDSMVMVTTTGKVISVETEEPDFIRELREFLGTDHPDCRVSYKRRTPPYLVTIKVPN